MTWQRCRSTAPGDADADDQASVDGISVPWDDDLLSDPAALADIREADAAYVAGTVIRGVDAVRALGHRE